MIFGLLVALVISNNQEKTCTPYKPIEIMNHEEAQKLLDSGEPIFFRLTFAGCIASPASQPYWEEVSIAYPQVHFVQIDCINFGNADFCKKVIGDEALATPSHIIAKDGQPIQKTKMYTPISITESSQYYQDLLREHLKMSPVDLPMIPLTNKSTEQFYKSNEFSVFIFYNGECREDMKWLGNYANVVNESFNNYDRVSFGYLDCSIYPNECKRWGSTETSSIIYKRGGDRLKILGNIPVSDLGKTIFARISKLESSTVELDIPTPVVTPFPPPPPKQTPEYSPIRNSKLEERKLLDMKNLYLQKFPKTSDKIVTGYNSEKCEVGTHSPEDINDSIRVLNLLRQFAGLSTNITNQQSWNSECQKASLSLHQYGQITHDIPASFTKCTDEKARETAKNSNLAQGESSCWESISGFIRDEGSNNAEEVGHRRWLLHPSLKEIGVGFYPAENVNTTNYLPPISVVKFRESNAPLSPAKYEDNLQFISWPSAGPFPIAHIPSVWSINYPAFSDQSIKAEDLIIEITRQDGTTLPTKKHLVSRSTKGTSDCLIIQMTPEALSYCVVGSTITVKVYIQNKTPLQYLTYSFTIFDESTDVEICYYSTDSNKCSSISQHKLGPQDYSKLPTSTSTKAGQTNSRYIITVVEPITLTEALRLDQCPEVSIQGSTISGTIIIGNKTKVDIENPNLTSIILELYNQPTLTVGQYLTSQESKPISIDIKDTPTSGKYLTRTVYTGPLSYIGFNQQKYSDDIADYVFGIRSNSTHGILVYQYVTQLYQFCVTTETSCGRIKDSYTIIANNSDIMNYNMNRRTIRLIQPAYENKNAFTIDNVVKDRPMNYELLIEPSVPQWILKYDYRMDKLIKHLKVSPHYVGGETDKRTIKASITFPFAPKTKYERKMIGFPLTIIDSGENENVDKKGYYMPKLDGDEKAKKIFDDRGLFAFYNDHNISSDCILTTGTVDDEKHRFFTTSGKCSEYKVRVAKGTYSAVMVQPEEGKEDIPVKLSAYSYYEGQPDSLLPSTRTAQILYIANYKDLTLKADWKNVDLGLHLINIGKYTMSGIDRPVNDLVISTGDSTSLEADTPITYPKISVTSSSHLSTKNIAADKVSVSPVTASFKSLTINKELEIVDSQLTLNDCTLATGSKITIKRQSEWPTISVVNGTFNPDSIAVSYEATPAKLLATQDEAHLFISGLSSSNCDQIQSKITLTNAPTGLKTLCSISKTTIYITNQDKVDSSSDDDVTVVPPSYPTNPDDSDSSENGGNNPDSEKGDDPEKKGLSPGAIAGIVIACLVVVGAVVGIVVYVVVIKPRNKKVSNKTQSDQQDEKEETKLDDQDESSHSDNEP
ncbi:hypothetical protein TRFO_14012 [Tritrichomonas foetus]|uniref:SCP domain-containing protein n=1 Tax=Tritrichomonas foetus TaxID=1144522 RepID=A0A1J4KWI0_9EUKA|nr:hypothetical protein TRFO_14012 [Tritrichomonas foetus]|eukprot:OHT15641.1 hypothetical protein TRFO_14012 [Tritrichomonas foetus]